MCDIRHVGAVHVKKNFCDEEGWWFYVLTRKKSRKGNFKGFTLVELVVVLVILGVLVALAVPRFTASATKAKETTFCSNVRTIKSQLELYKMTTGSYPTTASFVDSFLKNESYFESAPINPYTGTTFTATDTGTKVGTATLGEFNYNSAGTTTYRITSTPACTIVQ